MVHDVAADLNVDQVHHKLHRAVLDWAKRGLVITHLSSTFPPQKYVYLPRKLFCNLAMPGQGNMLQLSLIKVLQNRIYY